MKANVDSASCVGCGLCPELCPEVFEMNGDVATVKVDVVALEAEAACRKAMEECPVSAISLE